MRISQGFLLSWILFSVVKCEENNGKRRKVEYVRLPLLTLKQVEISSTPAAAFSPFQRRPSITFIKNETGPIIVAGGRPTLGITSTMRSEIRSPQDSRLINELIDNLTSTAEELTKEDNSLEEIEEKEEDKEKTDSEEDKGTEEGEGGKGKNEDSDEDEDDEEDDDDEFSELDLIELVQALERRADAEERTGVFPEILDILKRGKDKGDKRNITTTTTMRPLRKENIGAKKNASSRIILNSEGDLELDSEDLSDFSEEIIEGISEGVEESLRMSDDLEFDKNSTRRRDNATAETRQFSVYLFQGQYYAEPRLNRFIDGALRNMGTELRVASMDPLYFRVLPRGQVAEREQPLLLGSGLRRRRPVAAAVGRSLVKRQVPVAFFRPNNKNINYFAQNKKRLNQQQKQKLLRQQLQLNNQAHQRKKQVGSQVTRITNLSGVNWLKRKRQQLLRQRRRRQRLRQQKLKLQQQKKNRRKKNQQKNKQQILNRIRRRIRQDVGGGRIEGLSKVQRDGDAEMQLFGNYTLIRSHMKMGPVEITMQFRTKNGIRRSGATLACIRAHTVTRVNHEGSEMIDYLLDRPHPETIQVRGTLYPLAQRIARNIFARLFLPNSFLVSKLREKAALAFLSKPVAKK